MTHNVIDSNHLDHILPIHGFVDKYSQFSENQLRWIFRNRKYNGAENAFSKIGKRLYVDEIQFADWVSQQK